LWTDIGSEHQKPESTKVIILLRAECSSNINLEVADVDPVGLDSVSSQSKQTNQARTGLEAASQLY